MDFRSDNVAGAAPEIVEAVAAAARGTASAYGDDDITRGLDQTFSALFETDVRVFPVLTGTAANAIGLSAFTPPYGVIYAVSGAHVLVDECAAPELFTGGAKVAAVAGRDGKMDPDDLRHQLATAGRGFVHAAQPACISLTQSTEMGAVYTPGEITALAEIARKAGLAVHMDGARFANAVAASGETPAATTWRAGVDVLSFGATKNGALAAEAIVLFRTERAEDLMYRHKRAGQLLSKMRFVSAQLDASVRDGLWLRLADHANRMGRVLADGLAAIPLARLAGPCEANEIFVELPRSVIDGLRGEGFQFYDWPETAADTITIRLVTRHDTREDEVAQLLAAVERLAASGRA